MVNHKRYVPILRWRAAEKGALRHLMPKDRAVITPLVELVMPQPQHDRSKNKTPDELLRESISLFLEDIPNIGSQLVDCWRHDTLFLDVQLVDSSVRAQA